MILRIHSKIIVLFLALLVLLYFFLSLNEKLDMNKIDEDKIEDFDIVLSKGQSAQSKLISLLRFSIDDYSHVGIIVKENGKIFVLHSTPDGTQMNGIRYDDLHTFINLSSVCDFVVLRNKNNSFEFRQKMRSEVDRFKTVQIPFDYEFNNKENTKIYCSELVWLIFKDSRLFEASDFNLEKPIYPKYFLKAKNLIKVNCNKLSCDDIGGNNMVYSVDYKFQVMISMNFAKTLIRRIYNFTSAAMESFFRIGSLCQDCLQIFNQLIKEAKIEEYYKITTKQKHDL